LKVFISWSGPRSKALANALRDWLPMVLQYVKPWVSDKDISAGDRWAQSIAGELESSNFGIICITRENLNSEWIHFEAGALSKSMLDAKVIPLLFELELSDLSGPLSQFQAQKVDETGIMEVIRTINKVGEAKATDDIVSRLVPQLWPGLQDTLKKISETQRPEKTKRSTQDILEELVNNVRGLNLRMRDFDPEFRDKDRFYRQKKMRFHPAMLQELSYMAGEEDSYPISLLFLAGLIRDDLPWLAELLTESYREIRVGEPEEVERVFHRLRRLIKQFGRGGMMREMMGGSKEAMMLLEEMPMLLDMTLHHISGRLSPTRSADDEEREN
jgi:hypothetical protein